MFFWGNGVYRATKYLSLCTSKNDESCILGLGFGKGFVYTVEKKNLVMQESQHKAAKNIA